MRVILFIFLISISIIFVSRGVYAQTQKTVIFLPTVEDIPNPERGFMGQVDVWPDRVGDFGGIAKANQSDTLIWIYFRLDNYRSRPIDAAGLNRIQAAFQDARAKKMKVVARFIYNFGPGWSTDKSQMTPDAPIDIVLQHINQLKSIFQEEADSIAAMQVGFAGHWGEWHSSYNDLNITPNSTAIVEALAAALPTTIPLQLRYPRDKKSLYGEAIAPSDAFTGSIKSRIGHHNDCFLSDKSDSGTYRTLPLQDPPQAEIDYWKNYIGQDGLYTPIGGESCSVNLPRTSCSVAVSELAALHWSFMNNEYHPDVIAGWESDGCLSDIRRKLGYRFVLESMKITDTVEAGGQIDLTLSMKNEGYAASYNFRKVYLVFIGVNGRFTIETPLDPRRWLPGMGISLPINTTLTSNIVPGDYKIGLWIPDMSPRLQNDPEFSIRFANMSVWDNVEGVNIIYPSFHVLVQQSTTTPTGIRDCINKIKGDADCDGSIMIADFEVWRKEYFQSIVANNADFDNNGKVDIIDFEQWRKGYFSL